MQKTPNLGLVKPSQEDHYNIDDFNTNADILDESVTVHNNSANPHHGSEPTITVLAANRGGTGNTSLQATRNAMGLGNTTGVLPAANGGTGHTSLQATRNAMGLGNTTGVLPAANGGTGRTTGAAPIPTAAGVGHWVRIQTNWVQAAVLPAGGTWAWFIFNNRRQSALGPTMGAIPSVYAGVSAGGTVLHHAVADIWTGGFAWRLT